MLDVSFTFMKIVGGRKARNRKRLRPGTGEGGERKETIIIKLVSRVKRRNLVANQIVCIILAISS